MKPAHWEYLKDRIIRPDMDKHLLPLMLYRGTRSLGRMHRLWNFAINCMESEAETFTEMVKLSHNPDYAHLCGTTKPLVNSTLYSLFGRLSDNPKVTNNIPGFTRYVRDVPGLKMAPTPVDLYTNRPWDAHRTAPWRIADFSPEVRAEREHKKSERAIAREVRRAERVESRRRERLAKQKATDRFYPFLLHKPKKGDAERALMADVLRAVPANYPDWLRADMCQDLIAGIMAGDMARDELQATAGELTAKVIAAHPLKYGEINPSWLRAA